MLQTNICSDVSDKLIAYAERLEANPPRVGRMELASGLRRLAQCCIRGVRRASCRGTPDMGIPHHRSCTVHTTHTPTPSTTLGPSTVAGPLTTAAGPSTIVGSSAAEFPGTDMPTRLSGTQYPFYYIKIQLIRLCVMYISCARNGIHSFR